MKFIRFDSVGGASGDMILGTLIGLGVEPAYIEKELASLIPGEFHIRTHLSRSHGVEALQVTVESPDGVPFPYSPQCHHSVSHHRHEHICHAGRHIHRSFADIRKMIEDSVLSDEVKKDAVSVFQALAEAEGVVHSMPPEDVLFHEVGAVDSIVDIVGVVVGFHYLGVEAISIGPIPVGSGTVRCAHGVYPVPAPAVAVLLEKFRIPISLDGEEGEMLTPTGAVLLGWWKKIPEADIKSVRLCRSAGALGGREFADRPNLLRASLYEISDGQISDPEQEKVETLIRFDANLDDVSGEVLAHTANLLFQAGALDVWFTPVQMKKGRPAVVLSVLLPPALREELMDIIFRQAGTFGIREESLRRYALGRSFTRVNTSGGSVSIKSGSWQGEEVHFAPEFDECIDAAENVGSTPGKIYREAVVAYLGGRVIADRSSDGKKESD